MDRAPLNPMTCRLASLLLVAASLGASGCQSLYARVDRLEAQLTRSESQEAARCVGGDCPCRHAMNVNHAVQATLQSSQLAANGQPGQPLGATGLPQGAVVQAGASGVVQAGVSDVVPAGFDVAAEQLKMELTLQRAEIDGLRDNLAERNQDLVNTRNEVDAQRRELESMRREFAAWQEGLKQLQVGLNQREEQRAKELEDLVDVLDLLLQQYEE